MHSRLISWSRYAFLAGIVLALVLVIPTAWFPFQLAKVAAFSVALLLAVVFFVVGGGVRQLLHTHGFYAALLVALLPVLYFVSSLFSVDRAISISGFSIETDTLIFVLLAATAYLLSFTLFKTLRTARMLVTVVFWSLAVAVVFQLVSIVFGTAAIPLQTFADRSVNLIGKWNDLGILAAILTVLLFANVELRSTSNIWRISAAVGGVLLIAFLGLVNFGVAWSLLLSGCVVLGILAFLRQRSEPGTEASVAAMMPWYALVGTVVAVIFLLYGSTINASLARVFPVSSLEVRPGAQSTFEVIQAARQGSLREVLLGEGPNTFGASWLAHKPSEVNKTPFWNLDFNVGYSTLSTAFGSVGLLGAIAWMLPLLLLIGALVRIVRLNVLSREERFTASSLALASLLLFATLVFYVPSQNIILLSFILAGSAFGFLWRQGRTTDDEVKAASVLEGIKILILVGVLLVVTIGSGFVTVRRLVAQAYTGAGLAELSAGNIDAAAAYSESSQKIERTADAMRLRTDAGAQKLAKIAQDTKLSPEDARGQFKAEMDRTVAAGQGAISAAPADYRSYFALGRVYNLFTSLKVEGAYQNAQAAYAAAERLNPTSPTIPLTVARLEAGQGNAKGTEENVTRALQLKPDYTDAILFVVQINVANNDLQSAIQNTKIAVQTAPGVASIWFQLGLLYYAGGDQKNAVPQFEQAIKLAPDYANAKYFLGLSYYAQGRQNDALRLFQELAVTNPDNTEIQTIVANLIAGKKPLEGLEPETPPQNRSTAPVKQ